jgi:acyl-CoA synthetase (AMP-forming)/AMP-acid ligase II
MLKEYHQRGINLSQIFGQTETSTITFLPPEDAGRKVGSVGLPIFHGDVKIVDKEGRDMKAGEVGEIIINGPTLMSGYWNRPDLAAETIREGWLTEIWPGWMKRDTSTSWIVKKICISAEEKTSIPLRSKKFSIPTPRFLMQESWGSRKMGKVSRPISS